MSYSTEQRKQELDDVLKLMTLEVGDNWIGEVFIKPSSTPSYHAVFDTTWIDLKSKRYILTQTHDLSYNLTGRGWVTGCELLGRKTERAFITSIGKIAKVFKDSIKGRTTESLLSPHDVATEAGVSWGTVCNVIDAGLFERWYNKTGPSWQSWQTRIQIIKVPANFHLEII